jgi:hypothetical protein
VQFDFAARFNNGTGIVDPPFSRQRQAAHLRSVFDEPPCGSEQIRRSPPESGLLLLHATAPARKSVRGTAADYAGGVA